LGDGQNQGRAVRAQAKAEMSPTGSALSRKALGPATKVVDFLNSLESRTSVRNNNGIRDLQFTRKEISNE
jgi:hypothetical protein